jgi:hypothetical protein
MIAGADLGFLAQTFNPQSRDGGIYHRPLLFG